jgi:hypothetical protein
MNNIKSLKNYRSGRLVALYPEEQRTPDGHVRWRCKCDCGNEVTVQSNNLTRATGTKSCGCLRSEAAKRRLKKEGAWNEGKSYAISGGTHCYKTRHAWSKAVIRQLGNKCSKCQWDKARCDVHHKIPKAKGGLNTIENAVVLCPNCHREEHCDFYN